MVLDGLDGVLAATGDRKREGRKRRLTEKVRTVDLYKREELRQQRLENLERDNHAEEAAEEDDEEYEPVLEDEDEEPSKVTAFSNSRRKNVRRRNDSQVARSPPATSPKNTGSRRKKPELYKFNAGITDIDLTEMWSRNVPSYDSIAAAPSKLPARPLCSICGYVAPYTCPRCGALFCSRRCLKLHTETRCLKFVS